MELEFGLLPTNRTPQNNHGCCDGYRWDVVKDDCVGMSKDYLSKKINTYRDNEYLFYMHINFPFLILLMLQSVMTFIITLWSLFETDDVVHNKYPLYFSAF